MTLRIYDTRAGQEGPVRAADGRAGRHVLVRHHRLRPLPRRPRAHDGGVRRHRPPPARLGLRGHLRPQHHRRRRQDHPQGARPRSARPPRWPQRVHRDDERGPARRSTCGRPTLEPRATEHIAEVIAIIERLDANGPGLRRRRRRLLRRAGVRRATASSPKQNIDDLRSGARIEVGEQKHSPLDFALWKGAKPGEPSWDEPLGPGPARAGTSSARRWRTATSASRSTSTAAAPT